MVHITTAGFTNPAYNMHFVGWDEAQLVGWVERSVTHQFPGLMMGFISFHPSYDG
jgi:hypothetical protein